MAQQKTAALNIRINPEMKKEVEAIYSRYGITITDAVNIFFSKSLIENGLPFDLRERNHIPNAQTVAAIDEGRRIAKDPAAKGYTNMAELREALLS